MLTPQPFPARLGGQRPARYLLTKNRERILATLADGEAVESQVFGKDRSVDDLAQPIRRTLPRTRHRIRMMSDERDQQKPSSVTLGGWVVFT
jgi:hypothetical protein